MSVFISKSPDVGIAWHPLGADSGSVAYAGSFVAPVNGPVITLGCWFQNYTVGAVPFQEVRYDVCGAYLGDPANGPDPSDVRASSNVITLGSLIGSLTFTQSSSVLSSSDLVQGTTYFFIAQTSGLSGDSGYYVGGHTVNSGGISDNGKFWFSNDNSTPYSSRTSPEMGFYIEMTDSSAPSGRRRVNVFVNA